MTMNRKIVLRKNPDMVTRVIEHETILLPVYRTSEEIDSIYTLNESAAVVWELIDGKKTAREIEAVIIERFDTTAIEAKQTLDELLNDLREIKAVL